MPVPALEGYHRRYGVPMAKLEAWWAEAKQRHGKDWAAVNGTVKKMAENYGRARRKALR